MGSTSYLEVIANVSTVSQCSTLCRAHMGCTYWTLHKSGTYARMCYFWGEVEYQIDTQEALSGTAECGDVTNTTMSPMCKQLANTTAEHCNYDTQDITEQYDEEHCKSLLDHFNKFCGDVSSTNSTTIGLSSCICAKLSDGTEHCSCKKHR